MLEMEGGKAGGGRRGRMVLYGHHRQYAETIARRSERVI